MVKVGSFLSNHSWLYVTATTFGLGNAMFSAANFPLI